MSVREGLARVLILGGTGEALEIGRGQARPFRRQIKPAIMGQPIAQHGIEPHAFGRLTAVAGTEIGHSASESGFTQQ